MKPKLIVGSTYPTSFNGDIEVLEYINKNKYKIKFKNTGYIRHAHPSNIHAGKVKDLSTMVRLGETYNTKNYGKVKIIEYNNSTDIKVRFINTGYIKNTSTGSVSTGSLKDPTAPNKDTGCYIGFDKFIDKKDREAHLKWHDMINRCKHKKNYENIEVCKEWRDFRNFLAWHKEQVYIKGYTLDKDLFIEGNKVYGPDTCFYIPKWLNVSMIRKDDIIDLRDGCKYQEKTCRKMLPDLDEHLVDNERKGYIFYKYLKIHTKIITTNDYIPIILKNKLLEVCKNKVIKTGLASKKLEIILNVTTSNS